MNEVIDIKLTSICSPICQALIQESTQSQLNESTLELLSKNRDLLIIRQDNTVIGYALIELTNENKPSLQFLYFRNIVKDRALGEYWLSRIIKRYIRKTSYNQLLLAS